MIKHKSFTRHNKRMTDNIHNIKHVVTQCDVDDNLEGVLAVNINNFII